MISDYITGSKTPLNIRDLWQTPFNVFANLRDEFDIGLDAASSDFNKLCDIYLTEEQDSLNSEWNLSNKRGIWVNPPYSNIEPWVLKAEEQSRKYNKTVVMLLPADFSTDWAFQLMRVSSEIRIVVKGRLSFVRADTQEPINGNNKGSIIAIIKPNKEGDLKITTIERSVLLNYSDF